MRVRAYQKERLILPIHTCSQFPSALSLASSFSTSRKFINYVACLFLASRLDTAHGMLMDLTWVEMKVFSSRLSISNLQPQRACRRMTLAMWQTVISFSSTSCFYILKTFIFIFFVGISGLFWHKPCVMCSFSVTHTHTQVCVRCRFMLYTSANSNALAHLLVRGRRWVYPSRAVHFLEIMTAISSSQWLMTGRTNR